MVFPLYRRPGVLAFLDDDADWLAMLAEVMPGHWPMKLFLHPSDCIDQLLQEPSRQEADTWRQREILDHWRDGHALIPQLLNYWREDGTARFRLTRVCVVDYSMPAMNGLQVLEKLAAWTGSRVLLTGRADEQIAVTAFNQGLIEQFIPKQANAITQRLTRTLQGCLDLPHESQTLVWRATLSRLQATTVASPALSLALATLSRAGHWVEHVVIGDPFGVLALDTNGQAWWLQLEPQARLAELAEMAECHGLSATEVQEVRAGRRLFDIELRLALGVGAAALHPATRLCDDPCVDCALYPIPAGLCPGPSGSYTALLKAFEPRTLG